ncbi:hypothetical protein CISG_05081 [Coccidioides immitis RMSCC 3703]|uniref:FAD/NAD(P)-binding domain-containing protein n=1 Tax=Coccidioides immitis RMSCC 3703 TaxID=454286 RepID=A0A0J8QSI3_COCIT|nr:hypothetical protein CISG_05081 [Coccidioides immitis RMSCC 3703]
MAEAHVSKLRRSPTVIVIGAGPSGICIAHEMKHNMGFDDFMVQDEIPASSICLFNLHARSMKNWTGPGEHGGPITTPGASSSNPIGPRNYVTRRRYWNWYHERPNRPFTNFEKWCFKHIPFWLRWQRLRLFLESDNLVSTYMPGPAAAKVRERVETQAKEYIQATAPEKYHDFIVPKFPLGCKRRIFDPGYLQSLHASNIEVIPEGIKEITETGIISDSGVEHDFDAIVLATGFQVQQFLTPMEIVGSSGVSLRRQWEENRGAQNLSRYNRGVRRTRLDQPPQL